MLAAAGATRVLGTLLFEVTPLDWPTFLGAALFLMVVALTALEFLIAFLQAYVFAILTCLYLAEAVNMEHH